MRVRMVSRQGTNRAVTGTNTHIEHLSRKLARGIDTDIAMFEEDVPVPKCLEPFVTQLAAGADLAELKKDLPYDTKVYLNELKKKLKNVDIVHVHHGFAYLEGILAKVFFDKKLVITVHSIVTQMPWLRDTIGEDRYRACCTMEPLALKLADTIIATYGSRKNEVLKLFSKINPDKVRVIYNGIDGEEYHPQYSLDILDSYSIDRNIPYVFFIGKMNKRKGLEYLLRAADKINIHAQIVMCIAPDFKTSFIESVDSKIAEVKKNRIGVTVIKERLTLEKKRVLYSHASVVCSPSINNPSGLVAMEALACGTPVVASAIGSVREIIKHGESGFLVEPGLSPEPPYEPSDEEGFITRIAEATNRILGDRALNKRLSIRSRETVEQLFSWDVIAEKTLEVYKRLIKS